MTTRTYTPPSSLSSPSFIKNNTFEIKVPINAGRFKQETLYSTDLMIRKRDACI